ncbi:hypothetical protein IEE91_07530 [Kocuria sp. cx-455]|uniref:hypothetical protein n=1 Tax=Kocuria sp. cx-455 TaxID=2771377 RepID=UPI00168697A3|nr:hypothetical protein [Kocuria sp. cx-455]MBD2765037.1 hypothetical protein [Kocuria sp. cx-455]
MIHTDDDAAAVPVGWSAVRLGASRWIFSHDDLRVPEIAFVEGSDRWVLVHGLCLHAGLVEINVSPAEHLARMAAQGEREFLEALDVLAGRHVILLGDSRGFRVFNDATGMRSVYFSEDKFLVASHLQLIVDVRPHPVRTDEEGRQGAISGWDRTKYVGVSSLLPNHFLDISDWSVCRFYPRETNRFEGWSTARKVEAFREMWNREMRHLVATSSKLVMSLTGGADSRTSLALSMDHVNDIEMFTYTTKSNTGDKWSKSMTRDKHLVEEIKSLLPLRHRYFYVGTGKLPKTAEINATLDKNTWQSHGRWLVPHYANAYPQDDVVHLRGNAYEIGRAYWGTNEWNNNLSGLQRLYRKRTRRDHERESEASRAADFHRGVHRWEYDAPMHGFHLWDIFYWETRSGRWLAEILNETDIAFETFVPMNVRAMVEISLAFTIQERSDGFLFSELINAGCPVLNFPGKNDYRNLYEQTRDERLAAEAHHRTESPLPLEREFTVTAAGGPTHSVVPENDSLYIPRDDFNPGTCVERSLLPMPNHGELTFAVASSYAQPAAEGHWYFQVCVDGKPLARWDGAQRRRPVHVTVSDVTAGTRVSVQIVALGSHRGTASWERASRAHIIDVVLTERDLRGSPRVATDMPGSVFNDRGNDTLSVHLNHLDDLGAERFADDIPRRLDVVTDYCVIPLLVVKRSGAERTMVLCNGAVDQDISGGKPVFQRSTWWREIDQHQIYVCDPATMGQHAVSLAWGQYSLDYWTAPDTARAVRSVAELIGSTNPEQRAYYGSSAGGFMALALLYHDPEARALVNNAQFDWTRWFAPAVNALRYKRLAKLLPADLRDKYPLRTNVLNLLSTLSQPPRVDYWVNTASEHDREIDYPEFERFSRNFPSLAVTMRCHEYRDTGAGHNPLSKADTLRILAGADSCRRSH